MRKRLAALSLAVCCLAGCTGPDGEIYGEDEVREYVEQFCSEPYTLVGTELVAQTPDDMRYDFVTDGRGLTFSANSTLVQVAFKGVTTNFYTKRITCDYVSAVHDLYTDDVDAALSQGDTWLSEPDRLYLTNFGDLDNVVDTLIAADRVYAEELNWNPPEFLKKHPVTGVDIRWNRSAEEAEENDTWVKLSRISLTGQHTRQALYDELANLYAQFYVDGRIEKGDDIPKDYLMGKHVSKLDTLTLNGTKLAYDKQINPYYSYGLTTDFHAYSWYSYAAESYLIAADTGYMDDRGSFPLIIREYVLAMGGRYSRETNDKKSVSRWRIGDDLWVLTSQTGEDGITQWDVSKNGVPLDLTWYTVDQEFEMNSGLCVAIPVEDFCQLFDLEYTVDEVAGLLAFTSK